MVLPILEMISLVEFLFNSGKDADWPIKTDSSVIIFNPKDDYRIEGKTHDLISHAIKHAIEFLPEEVSSILNRFRSEIGQVKTSKTWIKTKGKRIEELQKTSKLNDGILLNTLDRIHDKQRNGEHLEPIEEIGEEISNEITKLYEDLLHTIISISIGVNGAITVEDVLKTAETHPIRFSGTFQNHRHEFIYDFVKRWLVSIRDDGSINTFFILNKGIRPEDYFTKQGSIDNPLVVSAMSQAT